MRLSFIAILFIAIFTVCALPVPAGDQAPSHPPVRTYSHHRRPHTLLTVKFLLQQSTLANTLPAKVETLTAEVMAKLLHDSTKQAFYSKLYLSGDKKPTAFGSRVAVTTEEKSFLIEHIPHAKLQSPSTFMSKLVLLQSVGRLNVWWNGLDARYIVYSPVGGGEEGTGASAAESASEPRN
jgi:hypothetical protein